MDLWLFIVLLSTVPSLHAHSNGAPYYACGDLMVQHGGNSQAKNNGYFILSDAVNDYTPGHEYLVELRGQLQAFKGFFLQARAENNQVSTASIVGVWTPLNTSFSKTVKCNKVDGDTVTHSSPVNKKSQFFMWRAPNTTVGRIHFMYSVVQAFSTFFDALNATEEKPISSVAPPTRPPLGAVFPNSYRQPEDCESYKCDFYVEWRNNDRFVDFRMEGKSNGWIVLGLSGDNTSLNSVGRVFSDILMCQAEPTGNVTNVKDLFLAGGSTTPMFDSSVNGTEYTSGRMVNDRIYCNFSRVGFVLAGQENQDVSFSDNNFLFFLAGNDTGKAGDIPKDFDISDNVKFSVALNLEMPELGPVVFKGSPDTLPGKGSFPSRSCNPDDCDFYFRWGVNPGNPNYLTLYINANISRGWAAIGVSTNRRMGGDEIDDVFGCVIIDTNGTITVEAIDTYNIAGGGRRNIGDGDSDGIVLHKGSVVDGRMKCTFSRVVFVLPENEGIDLNLNNSYYLLIGTGESSGIYGNFPKHQHNPQISTSKINLVTEASIDFDYSKVPLIKTHGIVMIVAWPVLGFLGILMANHMKPALPNGGWFSLHKIFMISSLCLTCCAFVMIFVAFRNAPTKGLITLHDNTVGYIHFVAGIAILSLQLTNPIIALFRCKPNAKNRWIFTVLHGYLIGLICEILAGANVSLGLYLFGQKYANPEEYIAFVAMLAFFIAFTVIDISFTIYKIIAKTEWVTPTEKKGEMERLQSVNDDSNPPKKSPSPDHLFRWGAWITAAILAVISAILATVLVSRG